MSDLPQRTLSDLAFIYDRYPDRRDVYVEGSFDESIVKWFAYEFGLPEVAVYPIAAIEIPDGELIAAGQKANNRERAVFLAAFLRSTEARRAACIVDADFSHFRGSKPAKVPLYETDYACMEMYFFCKPSFTKFLTIVCRRSDWPVKTIMDSLASVLQEFFLFRCANDDLQWGMGWLNKNVCMTVDGWAINLDADAFVTRFLNKNGMAGDKAAFDRCISTLRPNLKADPRHQMNGHDLTSLLSWYIRKKGISGARTQVDNVLVSMTMSLDYQSLRKEPMFQALWARFA